MSTDKATQIKKCTRCGCQKVVTAYGYKVFQRHLDNGEEGHIFDESVWWTNIGRQDVLNRLVENGIKSNQFKIVEIEDKPLMRHFSCETNSCSLGREDYRYDYKSKSYKWSA